MITGHRVATTKIPASSSGSNGLEMRISDPTDLPNARTLRPASRRHPLWTPAEILTASSGPFPAALIVRLAIGIRPIALSLNHSFAN